LDKSIIKDIYRAQDHSGATNALKVLPLNLLPADFAGFFLPRHVYIVSGVHYVGPTTDCLFSH